MAKAKTVLKYDFSFGKTAQEPWLFIKGKLSDEEMCKRAEQHYAKIREEGQYVGAYYQRYVDQVRADGMVNVSDYAQRTILQAALNASPDIYNEFDKQIMDWYAGHAGAQETYKAAAPQRWYWSKDNRKNDGHYPNNRLEGAELTASGVYDAPRDFVDVANVLFSPEARTHVEINREQIFEEGDIVCLRKPYVGRSDYDPHWRNEKMTADDVRYGTVMEQGSGQMVGWRAAKGSRKITVMWFGKNENVAVAEKTIKLHDRKGRITRS